MKTKRLWLLVPAALIVLAAALFRNSIGAGQVSVRLVDRSLAPDGQVHLVFEVTNGTGSGLMLGTPVLQEYQERTGWWDADGWWSAWHVDEAAGVARSAREATLQAGSAAQIEVLSPRSPRLFATGSAVRGRLGYNKIESGAVLQVRAIARRVGVPLRWLRWPKPGFIELPEAELPVRSRPAATPAAVVAVPQGTTASPMVLQESEAFFPTGSIKIQDTPLRSVLDLYAALAEARLEIDPRVRALDAHISLENTQSLTRSEAVRLFERALQQQAGVAVKRSKTNGIEITLE